MKLSFFIPRNIYQCVIIISIFTTTFYSFSLTHSRNGWMIHSKPGAAAVVDWIAKCFFYSILHYRYCLILPSNEKHVEIIHSRRSLRMNKITIPFIGILSLFSQLFSFFSDFQFVVRYSKSMNIFVSFSAHCISSRNLSLIKVRFRWTIIDANKSKRWRKSITKLCVYKWFLATSLSFNSEGRKIHKISILILKKRKSGSYILFLPANVLFKKVSLYRYISCHLWSFVSYFFFVSFPFRSSFPPVSSLNREWWLNHVE